MTPRILKIVAGLVGAHWALYALMLMLLSATAYDMGQMVGKLVLVLIVGVALLRVVKYGWGVSLFIICGMLVRETSTVVHVMQAAELGTSLVLPAAFYLIVNGPLWAALALMLRADSRAVFRLRRSKELPTKNVP